LGEPSSSSDSDRRGAPWFLWGNLLGLDAPIVAIVWAWFYARVAQTWLPTWLYVVLALAVWVIYQADRLGDVIYYRRSTSKDGKHPVTPRHAFSQTWFRPTACLILVATIAAFYGATFELPEGIFRQGLWLCGGGVLYALLVWSPRRRWAGLLLRGLVAGLLLWAFYSSSADLWKKLLYGGVLIVLVVLSAKRPQDRRGLEPPKELVAGLLFALGTFLPAAFYAGIDVLQFVVFWLLCSLNCVLVAWVDTETDAQSDPAALPQRMPGVGDALPVLLLGLIGLCFYLNGTDGSVNAWRFYAAIGLSSLLLLGIRLGRNRLGTNASTVLADLALLTPIPLALI